jgi:hypothetical protein
MSTPCCPWMFKGHVWACMLILDSLDLEAAMLIQALHGHMQVLTEGLAVCTLQEVRVLTRGCSARFLRTGCAPNAIDANTKRILLNSEHCGTCLTHTIVSGCLDQLWHVIPARGHWQQFPRAWYLRVHSWLCDQMPAARLVSLACMCDVAYTPVLLAHP